MKSKRFNIKSAYPGLASKAETAQRTQKTEGQTQDVQGQEHEAGPRRAVPEGRGRDDGEGDAEEGSRGDHGKARPQEIRREEDGGVVGGRAQARGEEVGRRQ